MQVAYSYLRFSSPQQSTGDSIRRQTDATTAWCVRNKIVLDASTTLRDEGISAFRGKHRENPDTHALAAFVQAVKNGRVRPGSYLIVESLDRLSREKIRPALTLLLNLIEAGIKVVQLLPVEVVYDENVEPMSLLMAIMELNRGHSESMVKSERLAAVWRKKHKDAATEKKIVSKQVPSWMRLSGEKIVLDAKAAATVRRVIALAKDNGTYTIANTLRAAKVPTLARRTYGGRTVEWSAATVYTILTSPALYGTYIPKAREANRGEPIPDYFPAIITEIEYHAIQAGFKRRRQAGVGRTARHPNILGGLMRDARSGRSLTYKRRTGRKTIIVPVGTADDWASFPADVLETALLKQMNEVTAEDIEGTSNEASNRVSDLSSELRGVEELLKVWEPKMDNPLLVDRVAAKLAELEGQRRKLAEDLTAAQREAASPVAEALGGLKTLADVLAKDNSDETRTKVRTALRRVVKQVRCAFGHRGRVAVANVRVEFVTGKAREYVMIYKPGTLFVDSIPMNQSQTATIDFDELKRHYQEHFTL